MGPIPWAGGPRSSFPVSPWASAYAEPRRALGRARGSPLRRLTASLLCATQVAAALPAQAGGRVRAAASPAAELAAGGGAGASLLGVAQAGSAFDRPSASPGAAPDLAAPPPIAAVAEMLAQRAASAEGWAALADLAAADGEPALASVLRAAARRT
ncbi:MAG: hypothetical protein HY554_01570, partial [Elusimicrobia bacterium]|nr:hypothetical protein [Elusimicrobiota bacterium]